METLEEMEGQLDKEIKRLAVLRRLRIDDPGKLAPAVQCAVR